ncbi:MAG: energy-coupling factor ABC transporter permease [Candidatus Methylarchaceae archaeon HK02M2]|nr:energy-coupling factor ABC transporter permease [Candidatus Methylarchaceae archaeon HK02M2]
MHIMEGFLPSPWWEIWFLVSIPIVAYGIYRISDITKKHPEAKPLLALVGAFIFVLSALKLPSVTGSCSHPTGSGLAAVLFGPAIASVLSMIVLVFQALLLAHGGLTTLGANTFSMGILGPFVAFAIWIVLRKMKVSNSIGVFFAVALGDLFTYFMTSAQLALAFPTAAGFWDALIKFGTVFSFTQIPLAIGEGILAILIFDFLVKYKGQILSTMGVIKLPVVSLTQEEKE